MWLLPTRRRLANLRRFFEAHKKANGSTPGMVIVDVDDFADNRLEYLDLDLPPGWFFRITEGETQGDKIREVWEEVKECSWLGLIGDDCVPESDTWDARMLAVLGSWSPGHGTSGLASATGRRFAGIVSCDDRWQAPKRVGNCWMMAGDLVRAVGYVFPPGLHHLFIDDIWETIGREANCWSCAIDVIVRHRHVLKGEAETDETHRKVYGRDFANGDLTGGLWENDSKVFKEWSEEERHRAVQAVINAIPVPDDGVAAPAVTHATEEQKQMARLEYARSRKVLIITPIYRNPHWDYSNSLVQTRILFERLGIKNDHYWVGGLPINAARNSLSAHVLGEDWTDALFIDDDMGWHARDGALRLIASDKEFIGAAGIKRIKEKPKSDASVWCAYLDPTSEIMVDDMGAISAREGLTKVGAAFLKLQRVVFERMVEAHPDWKRPGPDGMPEPAKSNYYKFFKSLDEESGEDFVFCEEWQKLGGRVWIDPTIVLRHWGDNAFEGCLNELLLPGGRPSSASDFPTQDQ